MSAFKDLTGQKFGMLTVIKRGESIIKRKDNHRTIYITRWWCLCDCQLDKPENEPFYFDLEDYNKIKDYCWRINCKGYVYASAISKSNQFVFMHNIVMDNMDKAHVIDHIYHDENGNNTGYDNRKRNLRKADYSYNAANKKIQSNNTSGCKGISYRKDNNKWTAGIGINKQWYHLGQFNTKEEAIAARKEAEEKYHKEFVLQTI